MRYEIDCYTSIDSNSPLKERLVCYSETTAKRLARKCKDDWSYVEVNWVDGEDSFGLVCSYENGKLRK